MAWRDIVTHWLSDKFLTQDGNLATLDLMKLLIEKNMIPTTLIDFALNHVDANHIGNINGCNGTSGPPGEQLYLLHER